MDKGPKEKERNKSPCSLANVSKFHKREVFPFRSKVELGFSITTYNTTYNNFHHISTSLLIHTYILIWLYDSYSLDPLFDYTIYALRVCMHYLPTYELHISLFSYRVREKAYHYYCLGKDP